MQHLSIIRNGMEAPALNSNADPTCKERGLLANQFRRLRRRNQRYARTQTPGITDNRVPANSSANARSMTLRTRKIRMEAVPSFGTPIREVSTRAVRDGTMTTDACFPQPLFILGAARRKACAPTNRLWIIFFERNETSQILPRAKNITWGETSPPCDGGILVLRPHLFIR